MNAVEARPELASLDANNLPEIMDITDVEALEYVNRLLERLLQIHEGQDGDSAEESLRRPSYDTPLETCPAIFRQLAPLYSIFTSTASDSDNLQAAHNSAIHEDEEEINELERQKCADLYKRFWLKEPPPISVRDYLLRFHRYCKSSAATYLTVGCLIYLISIELKIMPVTRRNVYRLLSAAFIVSAKFIEDKLYSMGRYATTSGLKKDELARLELSFLLLINFNIKADREVLKNGLRNWALLDKAVDAPSE